MKHTLPITVLMVALFLVAQVVGLFTLSRYIDPVRSAAAGTPVYNEPPLGIERPPLPESTSYLFIIGAVLIGTVLILLLVRFRQVGLWKLWFYISVAITMTIAFAGFLPDLVALGLALVLAAWKILRPNVYVHNFTEMFVYAGLAVIFVPIMNVFAAIMLLVLISLYDMFAVWKSGHMITLAKFQTESKIFAGLSIPYGKKKAGKKIRGPAPKMAKIQTTSKMERVPMPGVQMAILGGGDIAFPMIFAGVVFKTSGWASLITSVGAAAALALLFWFSKKGRFYPAMPFITAGCLVGYLVMLIV